MQTCAMPDNDKSTPEYCRSYTMSSSVIIRPFSFVKWSFATTKKHIFIFFISYNILVNLKKNLKDASNT